MRRKTSKIFRFLTLIVVEIMMSRHNFRFQCVEKKVCYINYLIYEAKISQLSLQMFKFWTMKCLCKLKMAEQKAWLI